MKFKIGDKVRVIKDVDEHKIGDVHIIENFRPEISRYDYGFVNAGFIEEENIELVNEYEKERIENLEKELYETKIFIKKLKDFFKEIE